jgi:hypothetical protein
MSTRTHRPRLRIAGLSGSLFFCALLGACGQAAPQIMPSSSPAAAVKATPTLLGRWKSTTDPLSELEITSALYTYQLATKCGCAQEKQLVYKTPTILTTRNRQDGDCSCYIVEQLTPTTLRLANYGQGGFLSFKRLK